MTIDERLAALDARVRRLEAQNMTAEIRAEKEAQLRRLSAQLTPELYDRNPERFQRLLNDENSVTLR